MVLGDGDTVSMGMWRENLTPQFGFEGATRREAWAAAGGEGVGPI